MAGTSKTTDFWLTCVFVYAGYTLLSMTDFDDRGTEFCIACPEEDFKIIESDYRNGRQALTDAKAFVSAFNTLKRIQKEYRNKRETQWTSPEWVNGVGA